MSSARHRSITLGLTALILASMACSLPGLGSQADVDLAVTQTLQAVATISQATLDAGSGGAAPAQETISAPEATEQPAATEEPPAEATPTPTVAHITFPANPGGVASFMTDRSTKALAGERRAIADNFDINLLERPFTSETMEYRDYLDIIRAELSASSPFIYITIYLEGAPPGDSQAAYGVEVDLDLDGHGDWLILGMAPPGTEWTTDGVRACRDANGDVGGPTPMRSDSPHPARDGYEDCVFDSGYGIGPDEAWIRRDPGHADRIQIAFLFSLIGSDGEFLWGAWADEGIKEPAWFDYHDHFTLAEAGSPASNSSHYPLKALALVDNTCRWGYGFQPDGSEPGACFVPPTPTPEPQGSISGYVYHGRGSSPSSERLANVTVTLGAGSCSSSGYKSTTTNSQGYYEFGQLPPGTYCVTVVKSTLPPASYGWATVYPSGFLSLPGTNPYQQVSLGPDANVGNINFGFEPIIG